MEALHKRKSDDKFKEMKLYFRMQFVFILLVIIGELLESVMIEKVTIILGVSMLVVGVYQAFSLSLDCKLSFIPSIPKSSRIKFKISNFKSSIIKYLSNINL